MHLARISVSCVWATIIQCALYGSHSAIGGAGIFSDSPWNRSRSPRASWRIHTELLGIHAKLSTRGPHTASGECVERCALDDEACRRITADHVGVINLDHDRLPRTGPGSYLIGMPTSEPEMDLRRPDSSMAVRPGSLEMELRRRFMPDLFDQSTPFRREASDNGV